MAASDLEQLLLEYINEARLDPLGNAARYISSYSPLQSPQSDIQSALSFFGVNGATLLAQYSALTPTQPLAWNDSLATAARTHNQAMINANSQEHQLPGEDNPGVRMANAGYGTANTFSWAENIYAYANNAIYAHAGFMVDWGGSAADGGMQNPPGHRDNIMSSQLREVGVGVTQVATSYPDVGPLVVTEDFASKGNTGVFILGVAYNDADHNNFYSVGEGLATLSISLGAANATSSSSGGYVLKTNATGLQTITLSGAGLSGAESVVTTLSNGENLKLDVVDGHILHVSGSVIVSGPMDTIVGLGVVGMAIAANTGAQTLKGSKGSDSLNGGAGADTLAGNAGGDNFVFSATALADAQASTPIFDHIADYRQGNTGHYSAAEADKIDVSGLTGGSSINGFVKVFDQGDSGTHLMVDANGAAGGVHYVKMAQLDGIHEGQTVNVITNSAAPAGITVGVDSNQGYAGNFNAGSDGNSDLIWVNDTSRAIKLFELNGHSSGSQIAANLSVGTLPTGWNISGIGDFNNDGNSDLLLQSNTGALKFWEMNGATVAHNLNAGSLPAGWHVKGTGDFNHDNISDVVLQNDTSGAVKLWEFNGHASGAQLLHNLNVANLPSNWGIVGVGDFNGDNNDDLLLRLDTGQIKVWEMTGNASGAQILANLNVSNLTLDWHIEGIGDFNNDGKSDMLLVNDSGALKLWEMNGAAIARNLNAGTLTSTQHVAGTGDFNGDGFDDILLRYDNGQAQLIELNGAASGNQILHNLTVTTLDAGWSTQNHHYDLV